MTVPPWPASGEIHIRLVTLSLQETELVRPEHILSPNELRRADRLLSRQARNRFMAGRLFLRQTLANYLSLDPALLCLTTNEQGKPRLSGEQATSGLCFNLSHTDDRAILALAHGYELGVDIEQIREELAYRSMAQRFFSPREQTELFSLPPELQMAAFYRCWTRKEAYLKGCGSGFSQPANCCDVSLLPGHPPALLEHRIDSAEPGRWSLMNIDVPPEFCAALAVKGQIRTLTLLDA
jgi:4'-phosphopantetheinyl transferase